MLVSEAVRIIENIASPALQYEWDNCGLLCGNGKSEVSNILVTLDVTVDVINEAVEKGCNMIVSHHPLIFKGIKRATADTFEGEALEMLIKNGIALYCAHTSLDIAVGGVNDSLATALGLKNVSLLAPFERCGKTVACGRCGELNGELSGEALITLVKKATGAKDLQTSGVLGGTFKTVALSTGAGEDFIFDSTCDVFITGEMRYHTALEAKRRKIPFITAGHFFTERCMIQSLAESLQKQINVLQYKNSVIESMINTNPYD